MVLEDSVTGRKWPLDAAILGLSVDLGASADLVSAAGREHSRTVFGALAGLLSTSAKGVVLQPVVAADRERLSAALEEIAQSVDIMPTNASLDPTTGAVRAGTPGRILDPAATTEAVLRAVTGSAAAPSWISALSFTVAPPRGDVTKLAALDRDLLGSFETAFDVAQAGRSWNISLAAARLDGTILDPGSVISFNGLVGARGPQAGFREAPELLNNELVPGFGGGVCQVATTLFNAALFADLDVVERYHHSRPLTYIGLGRDATVSYPTLDLVVRNSRAFPVILTTWVHDGKIAVSFWGRRTLDMQVKLRVEESNLVPAETVVEVAADLGPGEIMVVKEPFDGRDVKLWRLVSQGGLPVREEPIWVDHYEPIAGLVQVGPGGATAGASGSP